ncbi:MAG TPA: SRPBCC domain-containing protein [Bryobacteraceae bacterium]|jgi:uncharacterized protein YndB with AHSA1/START domain
MKPLLLLIAASTAFGQASHVTITKDAIPHRSLKFEVTIPASLETVWHAFSTSDGLSTWLTPGAVVDPRPGGEWTAHFPGGKTGGGTIISLVPHQEMVLSALAPEWFPNVRAQRTTARFRFLASGPGSTVVQLEQTGWKEGEEWNKAYDYLANGNAQLLETLRRRFVDGPIDWAREWGGAK